MSNMDKKYHTTKLKSNESLRSRTQFQSHSDSNVETNTMVCSSNSKQQNTFQNNPMPGHISKSYQSKCGGRGIIMKQLLEESRNKNSNVLMKTSKMNFSNSIIEQHFKELREENERKLREDNAMKWSLMFESNKNS